MKRTFLATAVFASFFAPFTSAGNQVTAQERRQPAPVTKESSATFRGVVKKVLPAVVSVVTHGDADDVERLKNERRRQSRGDTNKEQRNEALRKLMEENAAQMKTAYGSGVIIDASGVVLTNNHVVSGIDKCEVNLQDGRTFQSASIICDDKTDLAIIRLKTAPGTKLPSAEMGDSDQTEIGDWVLAMGSPFGLTGTVTAGIISAKSRPLGVNFYEDFLQTDAAVNPGNSGGPLVDLDGKIVGINSAIRSENGYFSGVSFAIPSNLAKDVSDQLVKFGRVKRGFVGITMDELDVDSLTKLGITSGVLVTQLTGEDSPAYKAGIREGDIVVSMDGKNITGSNMLKTTVARLPAGRVVSLVILRDKIKSTFKLTIEEQPTWYGVQNSPTRRQSYEYSDWFAIDWLGVKVEKGREGGCIVRNVKMGSPADQFGIEEGMVILRVQDDLISSPEDLKKSLDAAKLKSDFHLQIRLVDGTLKRLEVKQEKAKQPR